MFALYNKDILALDRGQAKITKVWRGQTEVLLEAP